MCRFDTRSTPTDFEVVVTNVPNGAWSARRQRVPVRRQFVRL